MGGIPGVCLTIEKTSKVGRRRPSTKGERPFRDMKRKSTGPFVHLSYHQVFAHSALLCLSPCSTRRLSSIATSFLHEEHDPLDLYKSLDFDQRSWPEKQWAAWYIQVGNPVIATGLMSFVYARGPSLCLWMRFTADTFCPPRADRVLWSMYTMDHH